MKEYMRRLVLLFLVSRLLLLAIGFISTEMFDSVSNKPAVHIFSRSVFLSIWGGWDTGFYLKIAREGFVGSDGSTYQISWYPLYPMAIRLLSTLIGNDFLSAIIISNVCLIGSILLLFLLIADSFGQEKAYLSSKYLIAFPSSMILSGAFSESLFLLLLILTVYLARKRKILMSCLALGLLSICRPAGVIAIPFLVAEMVLQLPGPFKEKLKSLWPVMLVPIPLILYNGFLWWITGDAMAFMHNKMATASHPFVNAVWAILCNVYRGVRYHCFEHGFNSVLMILGTVAIVWNRGRIGWNQVLLALILVYFPLFTGMWFLSASRYLLVAFPVYSGLALIADRFKCDDAITTALLLLQSFVMVGWVVGARFVV